MGKNLFIGNNIIKPNTDKESVEGLNELFVTKDVLFDNSESPNHQDISTYSIPLNKTLIAGHKYVFSLQFYGYNNTLINNIQYIRTLNASTRVGDILPSLGGRELFLDNAVVTKEITENYDYNTLQIVISSNKFEDIPTSYIKLSVYENVEKYATKEELEEFEKNISAIKFNSMSFGGSISPNVKAEGLSVHVRKNTALSVSISGAFEKVRFGVGDGDNSYGGYVEVTPTSIIAKGTNIPLDGFVFDNKTNILIYQDNQPSTASILVTNSKGDVLYKKDSFMWRCYGAPYIYNLGTSVITANCRFMPRDLNKSIWMFGDSYFSYNDSARWVKYLFDYGFDNMLLNHKPGIASAASVTDLKNLLSSGAKPNYIFWCLGMNGSNGIDPSTGKSIFDNETTQTISPEYKAALDEFLSICKDNGITPILATIPTVPNRYHEIKNAWVRDSGYRYVDFADAVGATADNREWNDGLLEPSDNPNNRVHPTDLGAKVLFARAISDFTELTIN